MAELTTEHTFDGQVADVFEGIRQYKKYPDCIPGVTKVEVLPAKVKGSVCQVRYDLKLIKTFYYTLNMFEEKPGKIWWNMDESNIMKHSNGSWTLTDLGNGKTKAVYALDVGFSGLVPGKVVDQITKTSLPTLFKGMQQLIIAAKG